MFNFEKTKNKKKNHLTISVTLSVFSSQSLVLPWLHVGLQSLVPQHEHRTQEHVSHQSPEHTDEEEKQEERL